MILCFFWILIFAKNIIKCEDFDIRIVNTENENVQMSFEALRNGTSYNFQLKYGPAKKTSISSANFIQLINSTGWGFLSVVTSKQFSDELQAYYAGVIEAVVTRPLIAAHISNTYKGYCKEMNDFCKKLKQYFSVNIESMVTKSRYQGGYWKMVRLMLWQIKGMQDGFDRNWRNVSTELTEKYLLQMKNQVFGLFLIQADGDLSALANILGGNDYHSKFPGHKVIGDGSCSAFIKYVKGDIYASHVTWSPYNVMLRLTKFYSFPYRLNYVESSSPIIPGQNISFSSYPGQTSSIDDFYITSGGLITMETTIGNYNQSLWKPLKDKASSIVFEYFRVQLANRLSRSGKEWSLNFAQYNSGTYNNQWMIINTNLMKGHKFGMPIPDGVLYVTEQIPGLVVYGDQTQFLRTSYYSSYNIPFYPLIYNTSGYREMAKKYGDFFTIDKGPRALIFKRDASKVNDMISLMKLMRYNDFQHDPLARCNCSPPFSGENGISARSDLNDKNGKYPFGALSYRLHGGTDMKATNLMLANALKFVAISSPTYDQQPVFDWRNVKDPSVSHLMHPTTWNFKPFLVPFPQN